MWYLNSTRIVLQKRMGSNRNTIARISPLSGGTVIQTFGYQNEILKLTGIVVGDTDRDALKNMAKSGNTVAFYKDTTLIGNFYVNAADWNQLPVINQTIRTDLACTDPVYEVDIELYE